MIYFEIERNKKKDKNLHFKQKKDKFGSFLNSCKKLT